MGFAAAAAITTTYLLLCLSLVCITLAHELLARETKRYHITLLVVSRLYWYSLIRLSIHTRFVRRWPKSSTILRALAFLGIGVQFLYIHTVQNHHLAVPFLVP